MNARGIIAGLVAGLLGAAAWAALAYYTGVEIGYLAWGIGVLVGLAVAAVGQSPGVAAGGLAVLLTVCSLVVGKYATVELVLRKHLAEAMDSADADLRPEEFEEPALIGRIANQIAEQREANGETIQWPDVSDEDEDAGPEEYFPTNIWRDATRQWNAKSDPEKQQAREQAASETRAMVEQFQNVFFAEARKQGFLASFGPMDLLFFGLAVASAWGIAKNGSLGDD